MTTAKTFKKKAKRKCRISKVGNARDAIGELKHGEDAYILTFGQFSLIDALCVILDQIGPADVVVSSWTAADAHLEKTASMIESASIRDFKMILDRSFETRQPEYCYHMRKLFGADCIRHVRSHAKFLLIRNEEWNIVVRTSMNLNENPRLENIEITDDPAFADFFQLVVDDIFEEVVPGEKRSRALEIKSIQETFMFKEIEADQIPRGGLNEAGYSHTIKKQ